MDIMKFLIRSYDLIYLINGSTTKPSILGKKRSMVLFKFKALRNLQPVLCFNIISRSKRYSLFPIFSSLIKPSFRNFRITL